MKFPVLMVAPMLCFAAGSQAQLQVVSPQQAQASHDKFSPLTIDAGDYVYVSGQGPRRKDGSTPKSFADQVRQSLENVKGALAAAGLTMDHLVYVQVYLEDMNQYGELDKAFADYFPKIPPARAVLGVARVPEPPAQITAVAVRYLSGKQPVSPPSFKLNKAYSPVMLTHDRLFVSALPGGDPSNGKVLQNPAAQVDFALDRLTAC